MFSEIVARLQQLRHDPYLWDWLPAGLLGGMSGGAIVAWLIWGSPRLLRGSLCFVFAAPLLVFAYLFAAAMGITFVILTQRTVKVIRRLTTPPSLMIWEPPDPMVELDAIAWPHPGCGIALYAPLILISALGSLVWFYLGFGQVRLWWMIGAMLLGLPPALKIAYGEIKRWRSDDQRLAQ
jgi:hypothetical protein